MAYGGFQARGLIRAVAASLHLSHSNARSECVCNLHHSSQQGWILHPLNEARDQSYLNEVPFTQRSDQGSEPKANQVCYL